MTTLAKIEANRRNGLLSTGPQSVEGKAIVARNATKHGIFAAVPVLPGECPEAWDAHRAGVVAVSYTHLPPGSSGPPRSPSGACVR